jgi:predicted DNA-binding WGR domain protein
MTDQWTNPPAGFRYILFERVDPVKNENRFYYLAWQRNLLGEWAVVRVYGRRGGRQHVLATTFASLVEAWPRIRALIRARLRHGYRIVKAEYEL